MRIGILTLGLLLGVSWAFAQGLYPIKQGGKWGLINSDGRIVVPASYDAIGEFKHHGYAIMQKRSGVGLLDKQGKEVLPPVFQDVRVLDAELMEVMDQQNWRLVNLKGETILGSGYEALNLLAGEILAYRKGGLWGLASEQGEILCPAKYELIDPLRPGFFLVSGPAGFGLLAEDGKEVLPPLAEEIRFLTDELVFYKQDHRWGLVEHTGRSLLSPDYEAFQQVSDQFIRLTYRGKSRLYAVDCRRELSQGDYDDFLPFTRQYVLAQKGDRLGLLNACGTMVLPAEYEEILPFTPDLFRVKKGNLWGLANAQAQLVHPPAFDYIAPPKYAHAQTLSGPQFGLLNLDGQEVLENRFARLEWDENQVKAYQHTEDPAEHLRTYQIEENGFLREEMALSNHFRLRVQASEKSHAYALAHPFQLEDFEWFFDPGKNGWGLRALEDGRIQLDPIFRRVQPISGLPLSLVGVETATRMSFGRTEYKFGHLFALVDHKLGRVITEVYLLDLKTEDFESGLPVARCLFADGSFGLIHRSGRVIRHGLTYIGPFQEGMAAYSASGELSGRLEESGNSLGSVREFLGELLTYAIRQSETQYDREFHAAAELRCESCSWGYLDTLGLERVKPNYDFARGFKHEVGIVQNQGQWGMVDRQGKTLIPCKYDEIEFLENAGKQMVRVYKKQPKVGLIDTLGHLTIRTEFEDLGSFSEGRLAVRCNGTWGYVDRDGLEVIPCRFDEARPFHEGLAAVRQGNKWGFIDKLGNWILKPQYSRVGHFRQGRAWATGQGGIGYINPEGKWLIAPQFELAYDFEEGVARVKDNNRYGLIDSMGAYILQPKYISISAFDQHQLAVATYMADRQRQCLINKKGEQLTGGLLEIQAFSEGLAVARIKKGYGFINTLGEWVIEPKYSKVGPMSEGMAAAQREGRCGYIDRHGEEVVKLEFSRCKDFDDGTAVVYQGMRKAGLVDQEGRVVLEPGINRLLEFTEGRGLVRDQDYRFYFITDRAIMYEGYYQEASPFRHGVAVVRMNGKWGVINQKGIEVIPPKYDKIHSFQNGFAKVQVTGLHGLVNLEGKLIVDPAYEYISHAGEGVYRVEQGDKVGYFDAEGKWIWELE